MVKKIRHITVSVLSRGLAAASARTGAGIAGIVVKLLVVTDTWHPQVNGVVRTLSNVIGCMDQSEYQVTTITPDQFLTIPHPAYPDIRLALDTWPKLSKMIEKLRPDFIFIATEGPLGIASRLYCARRKLHFTTSFTTNFPKYLRLRVGVPEKWTFAWLRWFHAQSDGVLVATPSMRQELEKRGFKNVRAWSRGVDTELFRPRNYPVFAGLERPIWLYVGRVAAEKNLDAFLSLCIKGTKVVVGSGPALQGLRRKYPEATFVGEKHGEELARYYSDSDVFVFPSETETFGIVMVEALACGTPVAAYPVTGPMDVITSDKVGVLHPDLRQAALGALSLSGCDCRNHALRFTWQDCTRTLQQNLVGNKWD